MGWEAKKRGGVLKEGKLVQGQEARPSAIEGSKSIRIIFNRRRGEGTGGGRGGGKINKEEIHCQIMAFQICQDLRIEEFTVNEQAVERAWSTPQK